MSKPYEYLSVLVTPDKVAYVDAEDYDRVNRYKWSATKQRDTWCARSRRMVNGKTTQYLLHRIVLNAAPGIVVDHKNRNGLDCRKTNLRIATTSQNLQNRGKTVSNKSGFKGVTWRSWARKWGAEIKANGKRFWLGYYRNKKDAARAYNQKAIEVHGEFARLNEV